MLDADLNDGDLSDLMGAITNALRPTAAISARSVERTALKSSTKPAAVEDPFTLEVTDNEDEVEEVDNVDSDATLSSTKPSRSRKGEPRQPEYMKDLDMTGEGMSFVEYAKQHTARKHARRFLIACAWFKEYGNKPEVSIDMVFTAYRHVNWPLGKMKDWDSVFRALRKQSAVTRVKPGYYEITAPGLGRLQNPEEAD